MRSRLSADMFVDPWVGTASPLKSQPCTVVSMSGWRRGSVPDMWLPPCSDAGTKRRLGEDGWLSWYRGSRTQRNNSVLKVEDDDDSYFFCKGIHGLVSGFLC
jgi:hypothetical protein